MPKGMRVSSYKNRNDQVSIQVVIPFADAKALVDGDKSKRSGLLSGIKAEVGEAETKFKDEIKAAQTAE